MKRSFGAAVWVAVCVLVCTFTAWGATEEPLEPLPVFHSRHGTFKLGKRPYPPGTREQWIREGRVLGEAPDGYLPYSKMLKGAADNKQYLPPIGNQGNEGSCVHWAGSYYTKTANMKRRDPSIVLTATSNQCSPRFTYNLTNKGVDAGGWGHEPFEIFMRYGVASLKQKPYVALQYTTLPGVPDFVEGLHRRSTNYVWVWDWNPTTTQINQLKAFLDAGGVASCAVYAEDTFDAWSAGDAPWVGEACSVNDINHMVTVCGYGAGFYLVANSWGTSFGSNGFIYVNANYFENYFADVMYPLEGDYTPATNYATLQVQHGRRSDLRSLAFSVNGSTVWSNSPLPKNMPKGTGSFDTDTRSGWQLAVDLSSAPWGAANVVTARCMDNVSGTAGTITNFTVRYSGVTYVSTEIPKSIPDNTGVPAFVKVLTQSPTNYPPVIAPIGDKSLPTNTLLQFTVSASDTVDGDAVTLWASGVPAWAVFTAATSNRDVSCVFSGTPPDVGDYPVTFYAGDRNGTNSETITIRVNDGSCIPAIIIDEGFDGGLIPPEGWTFTGLGTPYESAGNYGRALPSLKFDGTGDRVITPALNSPTNLQFWVKGMNTDGSSALLVEGYDGSVWSEVFNLLPVSTSASTQSVELADGFIQLRFTYTKSVGNLALDDVIIGGCEGGVPPTNRHPVISVAGGTNQSAVVGEPHSFVVTVNDADGEEVGLYTNAAPSGASFPDAMGVAPIQSTFTWTPSTPGEFFAEFVAFDAEVSVTQGVRIVASVPSPTLDAPVIQAASSVQMRQFNANWLASVGATGYRIDVSTDGSFSGGAAVTNLFEDFAGFIRTNSSTDISALLNSYMRVAEWTGSKIYEDNRRAKIGTSTAKGSITTPTLDLSGNGGMATLAFDLGAYGTDVGPVRVFHASDGGTFEQVGDDLTPPATMEPRTVSIIGGTAYSKIRVEAVGNSRNRFYLDNLFVTQGGSGGGAVSGFNNRDMGNEVTCVVTGLQPGVKYYYRARAYNASSNSANSSVTNVTTQADPGDELLPPTIQAATDVHADRFHANWLASANATGYRLDVSSNETFSASGGSANLVANPGFETGDSTSWTKFEDNYSVTTTDPHSGTYCVQAVPTATRDIAQDIAIDPPADGAVDYVISYWYRVTAGDGTDVRIWSSWDNGQGTPTNNLQPTTYNPTTATWAQIVLTNRPTAGATNFHFEVRCYNGSTAFLDDFSFAQVGGGESPAYVSGYENRDVGDVTTYPVTGLTENVTYYYRVRAYNASSTSVHSATTSILVQASSLPSYYTNWAAEHGIDPYGPDGGPDDDYDGDGLLNNEEYIAGTLPEDPTSFFVVDWPDDAARPNALLVEALGGRVYTIEFKADLSAPGGWGLHSIVTNITDGPIELPCSDADPQRIYRVRVHLDNP